MFRYQVAGNRPQRHKQVVVSPPRSTSIKCSASSPRVSTIGHIWMERFFAWLIPSFSVSLTTFLPQCFEECHRGTARNNRSAKYRRGNCFTKRSHSLCFQRSRRPNQSIESRERWPERRKELRGRQSVNSVLFRPSGECRPNCLFFCPLDPFRTLIRDRFTINILHLYNSPEVHGFGYIQNSQTAVRFFYSPVAAKYTET